MRSQDNANSSLTVVSAGLTITHNNDKCGNILTTTATSTTATTTTTSTTTSTTTNSCITTCPHKGKIQTLRQRKTELEKLLEEKNLLLQQLQKQEAHIINSNNSRHSNDWLTTSRAITETTSSSSSSITTTGGTHFHNDNQTQQQQHNLASTISTSTMPTSSSSSTLRRKVGSSFKLPRMTKKEHQADIENLLLEKKIQQEICNASYKLANDITLAKSVRRNQKAEYEAAQQKLSIINQNINILKKRQLRSHSTSFSESSPSVAAYNTNSSNNINTISGNMSSLSLKSSPLPSAPPPPPPPPLQSVPASVSISQSTSTAVLATNLGNNLNYNLKSNLNDYTPLLLSSKRNSNTIGLTTITNNYITNTVNNINNLLNSNSHSNTMKNNGSNKSIGNLKNSPNNYSSNDRRNSIKSAILNSSSSASSKHDNSSPSGLIQHFDRTLKNHRSDYDINRIVPSSQQTDKYQFIDNFSATTTNTNTNYRISGSYSLGSGDAGGGGCISGDGIGDIAGLSASDFGYLSNSNNNYSNTFPIQQTHNQRNNHHDIIDCDPPSSTSSTSQKHLHQQSQFANCENISDANDCYNINLTHDNEFEIMNRNRTSGNFEKLSSPLLSNKKDGRYCSGQYLLQNAIATTAISNSYENENSNTIPYSSRNSSTNSEYDHHVKQIYEQNLKQNKRYHNNNDTFDTVSLYPMQLNDSTNLLQQQQPQSGLGGYWKTLPNNERIWHSTIDDNNYDGRRIGSSINNKTQHTLSSSSYISNDMSSVQSSITVPTASKDELSDKISISSANSETNKKSREKQWLETSLDSPITHSKHSNSTNNHQDSGIQQRPVSHQYLHHHHHHHHDGNTVFSPSTSITTIMSTDQCNLNTIPNSLYPTNHKIHNNGFKERSKLSSQSMSNKMYQRSTIQQRLEDQSRLSHSTSVLNRQFTDHHHHHYHHQQQQQQQHQSQSYHQNNNNSVFTNENSNLYLLNTDDNEKLKQQQLQSNNHLLHGHHHHYHPLTILSSPTSINNRRISNDGNTVMNITSSDSSSYVFTSNNTTATISNVINNNNNSNNNSNVNINSFGSVLMTNTMCKAQEIRVESPKNMTVIQKAVFVPYKEVTKPFEMSDFYKYSTKFRQKDNQQQHTNMNNSGPGMILKQQQQHLITTQANSCETRNTTTVVGEVK